MQRPRSVVAARVLLTVLLASACCFGVSVTSRAQEAPQQQARSVELETPWGKQSVDLAKLYDAVVDTIEQKFFNEARLKEINWRVRADAMRPSVLTAATGEDAARQINALLAELKTSHTGLFTPDDYEYYILPDILGIDPGLTELASRRFWGSGPYYPGIGVFTRQIDGHHFVDGLLEGSPGDRAGLKYGDEILSVDEQPYSRIAAFRGKVGTTVELKIRREAEAAPQRLEVSVVAIRPTTAFAAATADGARIIERDGSRIGYVHIWSSSDSNVLKNALDKFEPRNIVQERLRGWSIAPGAMTDAMREAIKPPSPLDFLIVDMRGKVGGNVGVAAKYLELLDARDTPYWGHSRTLQRSDARVRVELGNTPRNPPFRGRSALLIDDHSRSAAELVAYGYKRAAFGPLVGTTTAGAFSSGSMFVMPGDLLLYVAIAGHELNGQPIEGIGVSPDHRVERPLPYAAGADPVLEAAVELLAKRAPK